MDNTIDKSLQMDSQMKEFFECISGDADTQQQRIQCIRNGLAAIADRLRLGKAEITVDIPKNRFMPLGERSSAVLYEEEGAELGTPVDIEMKIRTGGTVFIKDYPYGPGYSEEEIQTHRFIFREIFIQYNRTLAQCMLEKIMNTDINTGVANQNSLMYYAVNLIKNGRIGDYTGIFFNIHNFKYVNKVFDYSQGDVILRNYAHMVKSYLDSDEEIARLGGDNFVVICRNENASDFISKIKDVHMSHEFRSVKRELQLGVTAGIACLEGVDKPREVMARTSIAYQAARKTGAGSIVVYTKEIQKQLMDDQEILAAFPQALAAGEFVVYYQPKVRIADKSIYGAEALVRWVRDGQVVTPARFIPQFEREGSVCRLDYYMLEQVCGFLKSRLDKGLKIVPVSVNFSRRHLEEGDLVERITGTIDRFGIDRSYIEIELTESEDYQNYEIMSSVIGRLKERGISTSIDDFGTGFSSLNMIKKVDLDTIKIDKSLIPFDDVNNNKHQDIVMFASIIDLIGRLGKKSVAEGVETTQQLDYLEKLGCDIVQGYVFDKPLPKDEFEQRLESGY
ncbi:diguanylate cyclase (GGDEF) domain [Coprococcus sp. ART55/1]|uniref:putative bifunctional diguanylate cyclase/phosphodiesterase n=1 Tax=Coprococcus sp. ART55/1 TaxID=751585 RepID=UPI0001CCE6E0|nr:GGDEF domain-containing phosphodiesterase [Coprococcus sp. ART55/1]CBK83014.1 diguanylate cyclase (GGDEF) domain [Coprococcus sp. ART55/1]